MWAVLGPARPEEGTTCFRAGLGLYFYSLGWHGTARNFFGPSRPDPFWPEARWAWAVPARPGPIPSTTRHPFRRRSEPVAAAEDSDSIATHALFDSRMFLETVSGRNLRWNIQLIMVAAKLRGKLLPFVLYYAQSIVPTQRFHFILRVNLL